MDTMGMGGAEQGRRSAAVFVIGVLILVAAIVGLVVLTTVLSIGRSGDHDAAPRPACPPEISRPSTRRRATSRSGIGRPSPGRGAPPPCSILRRPSLLDGASPVTARSRNHARRELRRRRPAAPARPSGTAWSLNTRSNSASAASPAPVAVVQVDDRPAQQALGRDRRERPGRARCLDDVASTRSGSQPVVSWKYRGISGVRDAHQLAELLGGRLGDPDVVAERLRHLLLAVEALEQRRGEHDLGFLPGLADWRWRPMRMLKSWSVPPSSTSARTSTESVAWSSG